MCLEECIFEDFILHSSSEVWSILYCEAERSLTTIGHNSDFGQGRTCPPHGEDKLILGRAREDKMVFGRANLFRSEYGEGQLVSERANWSEEGT